MSKESVGRENYERQKDGANDALVVKPKMGNKDELELNWPKEKAFLKDKTTKDGSEASEIGNEKKKRKDRKYRKDKYDAEAIEVEEVANDAHKVGLEKARKDNRTIGDTEVGCEEEEKRKKRKDRKRKKDENDVKDSGVEAILSGTLVKTAGKGSKKRKKTKSDIEDPKDEQSRRMKTSDTEEKTIKKKMKKNCDDLGVGLQEGEVDKSVKASCGAEDDNCIEARSKKSPNKKRVINDDNAEDGNKGKKKKVKSVKSVEEVLRTNMAKTSCKKETPKRISFSEQVEVFPSADGPSDEENAYRDNPNGVEITDKDGLVRGKRFTQEEDEIIKKAVFDYIELHNLGEQGIDKILHCKVHREVKDCWKEIAAALPWRPYGSVYHRGHILFERDENSKWTADEYDLVRKFHDKHGSDWRTLADALEKHRYHVKHAWERIKLPNMKRGQWSLDEYQNLFDSVNKDLRVKAFEEKKSQHGMLRDNICWSVISVKLSTRTNALCCKKWYAKLASSMVPEGKWADTDDYRLMDALLKLDACCMEDVDWDGLLEHRPGDVCRKRWNQMVNHLGHLGTKSFAEQIEVLSERYPVDVLEAKEAYDSQTAADS